MISSRRAIQCTFCLLMSQEDLFCTSLLTKEVEHYIGASCGEARSVQFLFPTSPLIKELEFSVGNRCRDLQTFDFHTSPLTQEVDNIVGHMYMLARS